MGDKRMVRCQRWRLRPHIPNVANHTTASLCLALGLAAVACALGAGDLSDEAGALRYKGMPCVELIALAKQLKKVSAGSDQKVSECMTSLDTYAAADTSCSCKTS
jgi:hypothetical protein